MLILPATGLILFLILLEIRSVKFKFRNLNPLIQKGFTMIEMIVVFGIMAVLSTIAVAAFVNYNRTQILQVAVSDVSSVLGLAKSRAISQAKPDQCTNTSQVLNGYEVDLNIANNSYTLVADCGGTNQYNSNHFTIQTYKLPKNITFGTSSQTPIFFPVIVNGVVGSGTIYINDSYGDQKMIVVDSIGGIK